MLFIVQVKSYFGVTQFVCIVLEIFESLRAMCETKLEFDFPLAISEYYTFNLV